MKILVPTKRVPDTEQRIRIRGDGRGIDAAELPFVMNPFDAIALEEAVRIRERQQAGVEVLAVGIGRAEYEQELRTALAMGAERALLVECDMPLDPWNVARILQAVVERERPQLVLMGKQAVDDDANQTGQFLAALLDWPQAMFASKLEFTESGVRVARETDAGIEVVSISLPAVISTDLRLNEPRYASLPSMLRARKKPIDRIALDAIGITIQPRVELLHMESTTSRRNCMRVGDVDELLSRLRNETKVL